MPTHDSLQHSANDRAVTWRRKRQWKCSWNEVFLLQPASTSSTKSTSWTPIFGGTSYAHRVFVLVRFSFIVQNDAVQKTKLSWLAIGYWVYINYLHVLAYLFRNKFPALVFADAFIRFTEHWVERLLTSACVRWRIAANTECGDHHLKTDTRNVGITQN